MMKTILEPARRLAVLAVLAGCASIATPALADRDDGGYRGRGYDAPRYQNYDRGDWGRGHGHGYRGGDRDVYYVTPYYQPPRVIYAPPPVAYYPSAPFRSGLEVRLLQLF